MRRLLPAVVALLTPLLVAAADPVGDVRPCPGEPAGAGADRGEGSPDLVEATGAITELGTSVVFTLRFAEPLIVPDRIGRPFRVDVVLIDLEVPAVDAGLYRGVNRIVRYDAVRDPVITTLLLPEGGQSRFIPPTIDGQVMVVQVPGRTLVADEDETGTSPGLDQLRWSVIVRDEGSCDLLGNGRPSFRLVESDAPPPSLAGDLVVPDPDRRWLIAIVATLLISSAVGLSVMRRRAAIHDTE